MKYAKISVRFMSQKEPPYFIGSQLRGAFGYALKEVVCINPSRRCEGCFASQNCLYFEFFESRSYHLYRFDFELGKSYYDFSLILFEEAIQKIPYIISALHRVLSVHGLGKERLKPNRFEWSLNGIPLSNVKDRLRLPPEDERALNYELPKNSASSVTVKLITPLRIKYKNRFVRDPHSLKLRTLINSIYQRKAHLTKGSFQTLPFEPRGEIIDAFVRFKDLSRYSGRQKGHLKIGGLLGELQIKGLDDQSYEALKLAELIGVGKQTVFGLGKIEVIDRI